MGTLTEAEFNEQVLEPVFRMGLDTQAVWVADLANTVEMERVDLPWVERSGPVLNAQAWRELCFFCLQVLLLAALFSLVLMTTGCDENDPNFPGVSVTASATPGGEVHGTVSVSPSPLPPFEVRFRDESELPSPTPVEF